MPTNDRRPRPSRPHGEELIVLIIDVSTGTVLTAHTCVLVDSADLTDAEWAALDEMSDSEVCDLARKHGKPLPPPA